MYIHTFSGSESFPKWQQDVEYFVKYKTYEMWIIQRISTIQKTIETDIEYYESFLNIRIYQQCKSSVFK